MTNLLAAGAIALGAMPFGCSLEAAPEPTAVEARDFFSRDFVNAEPDGFGRRWGSAPAPDGDSLE